ncbi:MAG TPA: helix-turn-helix domain-containing protein [Candidatus Woesebacteria bacterium]|nr:helix-turn-helix domain-containing protein [Candidatus Woesebacteria bacterium]
MDNQLLLQTLGLTDKESQIYKLLLELGKVQAGMLIKKTGLKRATVYKSLYTLEEKGLVKQEDIKKKLHFTPRPPDNLLKLSDEQFEKQERARNDLRSILPQLTSIYTLSVEKPIVKFYEGKEGIIQANLEILAEKQEILAYVYADETVDTQMEDFWKKYYKIRMKDKIYVRSISPDNKASIEYKKRDKEEYRMTYLVPQDEFPIKIEKNIVANKVAFFSQENGKLIATIIENKLIADTERAIFELAWKEAEQYNQ